MSVDLGSNEWFDAVDKIWSIIGKYEWEEAGTKLKFRKDGGSEVMVIETEYRLSGRKKDE